MTIPISHSQLRLRTIRFLILFYTTERLFWLIWADMKRQWKIIMQYLWIFLMMLKPFTAGGVLHLENHDRVKAEADFKRSEEIDPDNMFTKLSKALIFKLDDRWEDAEKIYTNLINNEPNPDPIFYMNRAECYVNTNQMFKASADLRSLGEDRKNNPYFYFLRGRVRLEQFDKVAAKADFEKAKTLGYDSSIVNEWFKKIE